MNKLAQEVMNESGIREFLKRKNKRFNALESLDCLKDLRLTSIKIFGVNHPLIIKYEASCCLEEVYKDIKGKLGERGLIEKGDDSLVCFTDQGKPNESKLLYLNTPDKNIRLELELHNPNYKK